MNGKVVLSFILGAAGMYFGMKRACEVYIANEIDKFKDDYETSHEPKPEEKSKDLKEMDTSATEKSISSVDTDKKDADSSKDGIKMAPKECLIQFKEAYCEKDPKNNKDPEFRCRECLFRQDNICLINAFISRQFEKED